MAFATKYRCEIADNLGIVWKVDIQENAFGGEITTLRGSGSPINFSHLGEDDIQDQVIMGSIIKLEVKASTDFAYSELFTSDNLQFKVLVYEGATLHWSGYIQPNTWTEPYNCTPYSVTITATDGLAQLKDYNFKDFEYSARQKTSVVIYAILGLIGITTFMEYINLFESTMNAAVGDSPLDQSGVDPELFEDMNCYEALEEILKSFGAAIRQDKEAIFTLYRIRELADTTMYGRIFTSGTAKSATTKTPAQYINRTAHASNFRDHEGGVLSTIAQIKELYLNQDYGLKPSILKTYNFPYDDFSYDAVWSVANWTKSSGTTIAPIGSISGGSGQENGIVITNADTSLNHNIYQEINHVINSSERPVIDFEFAIYTDEASPPTEYIYAYAEVQNYEDGGTVYYLKDTAGVMSWTTTPTRLTIGYTNSPTQNGLSWEHKVYKFPDIPHPNNIKIKLYAAVCASAANWLTCWKETKLYFITVAEGITIEGIGYMVTNSVTGGKIIEKEYILGDAYGYDNDHLQYKGALNVWDDTDPISTSASWASRGGSEDMPLMQLISEEIAGQYSRPKQLLSLPVYETHDDDFISLVGNFQDVINEYDSNPRKFAISRADFDVKNRHWSLNLSEIIE